jgi:hypothetical protein
MRQSCVDVQGTEARWLHWLAKRPPPSQSAEEAAVDSTCFSLFFAGGGLTGHRVLWLLDKARFFSAMLATESQCPHLSRIGDLCDRH